MKLWQKIFLYTMMLVMLAVGVTSILVLRSSFQLSMEQKRQSAYTEHEFLVSNFKSLLLSQRLRQNVLVLEQDQIAELMRSTFQEGNITSGLIFFNKRKQIVYEKGGFGEMSKEDEKKVKALLEIVADTGENYMQHQGDLLYILTKESLETNTYYFLTVTDISQVYGIHREMMRNVRTVCLVCAVAISVILLIVVKLLLRPLSRINQGTRAIARGDYRKRVPRKGRDELSELAYNMNRMAYAIEQNIHALEDVAEDRKKFIDNLSHEMKTPLTSILGFADLLQIQGRLSEEQRMEYAGIIKDEASRMRTLSGKLMELITVGEANIEWTREEMRQLFREMGMALCVVAESHGMRFSLECEKGYLWVDRELIKSLVYNLTDNAIKASKEGDPIAINGWFEEDSFFFSVADKGIGIPREEIEKITQAFYMVDKVRSRASGGAGLGLALCVEIAQIHQGNLSIESEIGVGTVITVRMKGGEEHEAV